MPDYDFNDAMRYFEAAIFPTASDAKAKSIQALYKKYENQIQEIKLLIQIASDKGRMYAGIAFIRDDAVPIIKYLKHFGYQCNYQETKKNYADRKPSDEVYLDIRW